MVKAKRIKFHLTHVKGHDVKKDKKRKALHEGRRVSEEGNIYYEYRENRADLNRHKRL